MYEDRLEGRITPEMYDWKASDVRSQRLAVSRRIYEITAHKPTPVEGAINIMDLTSRAADLFLAQPPGTAGIFARSPEIRVMAGWRVCGPSSKVRSRICDYRIG